MKLFIKRSNSQIDIRKGRRKSFTLIELLVATSIIGLLSSVVLTSVGESRKKAQIARAKIEMKQIETAIIVARGESGKLLWEINSETPPYAQFTAACSSACITQCKTPNDLRNVPENNICYEIWEAVLDNLEAHSGGIFPNLDGFRRDVWGSPYVIDENEGVSGQQCGLDFIRSGGPDGQQLTSDDIAFRVPFMSAGKIFRMVDHDGEGFDDGRRCICQQPGDPCTEITPLVE